VLLPHGFSEQRSSKTPFSQAKIVLSMNLRQQGQLPSNYHPCTPKTPQVKVIIQQSIEDGRIYASHH